MEYVEQVFYRKLNASDFKKLYDLDKPDSGGGQTYLEAAGIETEDLVDFLKYGEKYDNKDDLGRDSYLIHAYSLGEKSSVEKLNCDENRTFLFFDPRHDRKNYRICNQTKSKKHQAWTIENDFPEPNKNSKTGQYESSSDFAGIIDNLCIIIIRTSYKKYYASYINTDIKPDSWPDCFTPIFSQPVNERRGIIKIVNNSIEFKNDKEYPFKEISSVEYTNVQSLSSGLVADYNQWTPIQKILYGVPGAGKSYSINSQLSINKISKENTKRIVFHQEYTNSDFIGQIIPKLTKDADGKSIIDYQFKPGPFSEILRLAYENPDKNYALIIEEINRGNAPAIFGELFQLLDRLEKDDEEEFNGMKYTKGWSSYGIDSDVINAYFQGIYDTNDERKKHKQIPFNFDSNSAIRLPPNLSLFATMNTSDQNVFKLDNAFKRRWDLQLIKNDFDLTDENQRLQCNSTIEGFNFTWGEFRLAVNKIIVGNSEDDNNSFSDKQLGSWFVKNNNGLITSETFANKVLEYLWDDVFPYEKTKLFNKGINSIADIITRIEEESFDSIFNEGFLPKINEARNEINTKIANIGKKSENQKTITRLGKRISFNEVGLTEGTILKMHYGDKDYQCKIADDKAVIMDDIRYKTLTACTRKIMGLNDGQTPGKVSEVWTCETNGKSLKELQFGETE